MAKKSNGCSCGLLLIAAVVFGVALLFQPSPAPKRSQDSAVSDIEQQSFRFVSSKTEKDGWRNVMELYGVQGQLDRQAFRRLCVSKKANATAQAFTYIVLFDRPENAAFPNSPFTSQYGLEEDKLRHIVAIYEYNKVNGFSQLTFYSPNMWEGRPEVHQL